MSQRKSVAFQFSHDANSIQHKDLDYAMYAGDVLPELTKEQLIDLIKNEYNVQLAEIESTVSFCAQITPPNPALYYFISLASAII